MGTAMHVLAISLSLIWVLLLWRLTRGFRVNFKTCLMAIIACCLVVIISQPSLWQALYNGYPGDSFFTLKTGGRVGVLAISGLSILLFSFMLDQKSRWILRKTSASLSSRVLSLIADCALGLAVFGFLYSLSPQIYYTFYRVLIPGLPNQIVIQSLFDWERLHLIAGLPADGSLSHHLSGIVLLAIIPFTAWRHAMDKKWGIEGIILMIPAVLALQYTTFF